MAVDMTDPAAVRKFLESVGSLANSVPAPQPTAPSAPTSTYSPPSPTPPQSYGVPAPPKDMSGFKSSLPTFGMPPAPTSTPAPVPAPTATTTATGGVSGTLSASQRQTYDSLPPEQRAAFLMSLGGSPGSTTPGMPTSTVPAPISTIGTSSVSSGYPTSTPTPISGGYPVRTTEQIRADTAAKIEAEIAKRTTAAAQAKTGIQTSYDRLRTNVGQDRVLQDLKAARNANPSSGKTSYDKGITNMERERTDREQSQDLQTRLANIDVSLQDYINATPAEQREMENAAIQQERSYALQVDQLGLQQGQLTGNYGGGRTIAGQTIDQNKAQDKINNDRNTANDALALRKQHIDEANYYSDKYGITVEPKDDFQEVINQVKGLPTAAQQTAAQKAEDAKRSEAWKRVEQFGVVQSQADADLLGVPVGTQTAAAKQLAVDNAFKNRSAATAEKNAETSAKNAETAANKPADTPKPTDPMSYIARFNDLYVSKDPYTGDPKVTNPAALKNAIIALNLPDADTDKLLLYYGIQPN